MLAAPPSSSNHDATGPGIVMELVSALVAALNSVRHNDELSKKLGSKEVE